MRRGSRVIGGVFGLLLLLSLAYDAHAKLRPEQVPTFQLRARVTSRAGKPPAEQAKFTFRLGPAHSATAGGAWGEWMKFDRARAEATLKGYPAIYMKGFPVVTALALDGVTELTAVEAELKLDEGGEVVPLAGELFGPELGIVLWRDEQGKPKAATRAVYNQRYWKQLEGVHIPEAKRPKKFPVIDRFIAGDDDRRNWRDGIDHLSRAGFSAIMLPPSKPVREIARELGVTKTAWAVYSPPGYAFDWADPTTKKPPQPPEEWARQQAKPYTDAGWDVRDVAAFALSDEPGWYYPATLKAAEDPAVLKRFHAYLEAQGLKPADVGAASWDAVKPIGRSKAKDLPSKRLFYWSTRFFPHESARYFAECTRAMEAAFYPGIPLTTNWNFFAGRSYVPGPVANNADKQSPDAAMGGHDWLEFGRMRGGTMLWTEDWFPDAQAQQWSFYCAKLRSAGEKGGVPFGGYVIGRTAGDREDGVLQKTMCLVGSGGKAVKYYVFGPEYSFPGNCYSEKPGVLKQIAEANAMIGAAEDLLWEGKRPKPQVAILMPRSSQVWDLKDMPVAKGIEDATNTNLFAHTMDYMAEVYGLYLALQHANIPVDFVDEDDLLPEGLKDYKVLLVTAPNVPEEGQRGLVPWLKAGGMLLTVTGAAARDRYDEPCTILSDATGIVEQRRQPMPVSSLDSVTESGRVRRTDEPDGRQVVVFGPRGRLEKSPGQSEPARFGDGSPAVVGGEVGKGTVLHLPWLPGLSYARSVKAKDGKALADSADLVLDDIGLAAALGGGVPPVIANTRRVETPMLLSEKGAAVTALNWRREPVSKLDLTIDVPFKVRTAEAVRAGPLAFQQDGKQVKLSLPLKSVDVILLRP